MSPIDKPLVSVYMPTKNRVELLSKSVDSVLTQSYPNIELIIVDDGSTDNTADYLLKLTQRHSNVVVLRNEESKGACAARNKAINIAKGKYITGLDDDDLFLPHRIESLHEAYQSEYAFVCSSMFWDYGKRKRVIDSSEKYILLEDQLNYNEATSQIFTETRKIKQIGGFDETFVACQDYDLWTRLLIEFGKAKRIAVPTYIINDSGSSNRMINDPKSVKGYQQFIDKHQSLLSQNNIKNLTFMMIRRRGVPLSFSQLLNQIGSGHFYSKLRYYLSSNFNVIKNIHGKFYKS